MVRFGRFTLAVVVVGQTFASGSHAQVSSALRTDLQSARLEVVTAIRGLPLGVRENLTSLFGGALDIANPGEDFQGSAGANVGVPMRRLIAAGCSIDLCVVYYERGGGGGRSWHAAVFHWTPAATTLEFGGTAPAGLKTADDVRAAILGNRIKSPSKIW